MFTHRIDIMKTDGKYERVGFFKSFNEARNYLQNLMAIYYGVIQRGKKPLADCSILPSGQILVVDFRDGRTEHYIVKRI